MSEADAEELNVLVVDDDPAMRELLAEIIHRAGHRAITAESAEKALEVLPLFSFQVAFLDQRLPGMEGLLLGEYLRRSSPDMILALVSGDDDRRVERRTRELRVAFIAKPFDNAKIHAVLNDYIEAAKERAAQRARREDPDFAAPIGQFASELADCFGIPKVPARVSERVVGTVQRSLNNLRSVNRYSERERVIALSGLLTARVLGLDLPRTSSGLTLYEEYDRLMQQHGRRTEFGAA